MGNVTGGGSPTSQNDMHHQDMWPIPVLWLGRLLRVVTPQHRRTWRLRPGHTPGAGDSGTEWLQGIQHGHVHPIPFTAVGKPAR
jgi:hypothetical protein